MIVALASLSLSAVVALHADTLPGIIDPPLTQFAWLGRSVTFKVSYSNQTVMDFQWQWNGANVSDATNTTLRLTSVQPTNSGDYRVVLGNAAGVVTSAVARLTVRDWPQPTGVSFTNLASLESNLKNVLRLHDVPGASLAIMKDGRLILARGYGYADPEHSEEDMQVSSDLKTWQPFEAAANEQLGPDGMLTVNIQDAATDANQGARFYRVNVRRP